MTAPMIEPMMPGRLEEAVLGVLVEEQVAEETADERADDAEHDRHQDADVLLAGDEQAGEAPAMRPTTMRLMIRPSMAVLSIGTVVVPCRRGCSASRYSTETPLGLVQYTPREGYRCGHAARARRRSSSRWSTTTTSC